MAFFLYYGKKDWHGNSLLLFDFFCYDLSVLMDSSVSVSLCYQLPTLDSTLKVVFFQKRKTSESIREVLYKAWMHMNPFSQFERKITIVLCVTVGTAVRAPAARPWTISLATNGARIGRVLDRRTTNIADVFSSCNEEKLIEHHYARSAKPCHHVHIWQDATLISLPGRCSNVEIFKSKSESSFLINTWFTITK